MKKQNNGLVRNPFLYLLIIFFLVTGFQYFYSGNTAGRSEKINYTELVKEIKRTKREFLEKDYKEYSFPISISDLEKNIDNNGNLVKGASWNAKAAYTFNKMLEKSGITYIPPIKSGDKINILYLKDNNPFGSSTIAYVEDIPEEWNLGNFVDKGKMFERFFLNPVKSFSDYLSWHTNQVFDPSIYENSDKPKKVRKRKSEVARSP